MFKNFLRCCLQYSVYNFLAMSLTSIKNFNLFQQCNNPWEQWQQRNNNGYLRQNAAWCCSLFRACCHMFKQVVARHVAAFSSMLQPGHVVALSSMLQPDMLPPVSACCSLIRTCCRWDRIFSSLLVQTSLCAAQAPINQRHFQVKHRHLVELSCERKRDTKANS